MTFNLESSTFVAPPCAETNSKASMGGVCSFCACQLDARGDKRCRSPPRARPFSSPKRLATPGTGEERIAETERAWRRQGESVSQTCDVSKPT